MNTDLKTNTDERHKRLIFQGLHSEITEKVIGVFFEVYNELGGGFRGQVVGNFRADLVVDDRVLLELKAISALDRAHDGQVLHYLRATRFEVGLLLNFGPRAQFRRFILEGDKKKIRVVPRESAVEALKD